MEKVYLARVSGVFPEEPLTVNVPLVWDPKANEATAAPAAAESPAAGAAAGWEAEAGAPAADAQQRDGAGGAKPAVTAFQRIAVAADGATSLVECRRVAGLTPLSIIHLLIRCQL